MQKVAPILKKKEIHFNKIDRDCSLLEAINRMNSQNIEYLVVTDYSGSFIGLLTEQDIVRRTVLSRQSLVTTKVFEAMNNQLPFADMDDSVEHCLQLMKRFKIRYLPIFHDREFRGIVTSDDILEEVINSKSPILGK
jgi:CBS domain-containing protein